MLSFGLLLVFAQFGIGAAWADRGSERAIDACRSCHDADAPRLEGLSKSYLTRQIQGFVRGERGASLAGRICAVDTLKALRPADLLAVVNTWSASSPTPDPVGDTPPELIARGRTLFQEGRLEAGVQACAACHGHDGTGGVQRSLDTSPVAPRVAGQRRAYLDDQLLSFRKGVRKNDYSGIMRRMVVDLNDTDLLAVSAYLATLDPATVPPPPAAVATAPPLPEKAALCQACHGVGGESMHETFPKIAGLSKGHIQKQLLDIQATRRTVDVMTPVVFALTPAEIAEISAYFSTFEMHRGPYDPLKARRGEVIFHNGNLVTGYPACMVCHGVDGRGLTQISWAPGDIPRLAGQHPGYIKKALYDFKSGKRQNDHSSVMRAIAGRMTDQEIDDVSHFLYSLGDKLEAPAPSAP